MDEKDARIAYAVYRLGLLPEGWNPVEGLKPIDFIGVLDEFIASHYTHAYSVRSNDDPICVVFGIGASEFIIIGDVIWNPKASNRQKIEAHSKFFTEINNSIVFSDFDNKKFYERLMDYKILRRVGTVYKDGQRLAQFQTRV